MCFPVGCVFKKGDGVAQIAIAAIGKHHVIVSNLVLRKKNSKPRLMAQLFMQIKVKPVAFARWG